MEQKKVIFGAIVIVIIFAIAGYAAWKFFDVKLPWPGSQQNNQAPPQEKSEEPVRYGTLPEMESTSNPLENMPELNPAERANPFKDIIKNPFE